jgi:hypothetical protein
MEKFKMGFVEKLVAWFNGKPYGVSREIKIAFVKF